MIDHITVSVTNIDRSRTFYDLILAPLGIERLYADGDLAAGYGYDGKAFFWIAENRGHITRVHVAFAASSHEAIIAFHRTALSNGGTDNGAPGLRPQYNDRYYAAFVLDPDGNNIEAVIQ